MNDPILQALTAISLILIPVFSSMISKKKLKRIFLLTYLSLGISFPMFLFVVIVPDLEMSKYLFYISMSLWTGGFFSIFINLYIYKKRVKARSVDSKI
ncbi:MAG: hypothetical protein K8Q99_01785 [Acholeplasmataceae bacterium]|nr:hypothetical protein [Acholeplasmataceae bacterium]